MTSYVIDTSRGRVVFLAETPRPATLIIHGFKRAPGNLAWWRDKVPNPGFVTLPGHGRAAELDEVSVEAWIDAWRQALSHFETPPTIVAESLGAIVAMCLPARAVVAVEPLLTVDHLWPQHRVIRNARARGIDIGPAYEALFNRPYDWVLNRITAPTLVIAGDLPLLPERQCPVAPSLLTDEDFARYADHPLVEAHRIRGGHTLMDENPDGVLALAGPFLARHATSDQSA
ncbi:MAG: alpha/beta hydrolase [Phenylobacterium sp.]|nr:alpha/beta hydrolase [Streptosporangiaceae bacterium]MDB5441921.1 alpha/beta hydrolase [Phenylobacterium sp.]MDB5493428.1 alpha/beta hydrolase [Phenylobacterium sp.]